MQRSTALLLLLLVAAACTAGARYGFVRTLDDLMTVQPPSRQPIEEPPEPFTLRRRELYVGVHGHKERRYFARAAALFGSRIDLAALPYGTPVTVWSLGEGVIAAEVVREKDLGGSLFALPAFTRSGLIRFYDESGRALDGPFFARPVEYNYISSAYGPRVHPITGRHQRHRGVDLSAARGTPVVSVGDGVVIVAGEDAYAGIHVVIRHRGITTRYLHLDALAEGVTPTARVTKGQTIGVVGSTGMSTGPHLHFEVLRKGARVDPSLMEWPTGEKLPKGALEAHRELAGRLRAMTPEQELVAWHEIVAPSPAS